MKARRGCGDDSRPGIGRWSILTGLQSLLSFLRVPVYLGLVVQNRIQQRIVNFNFSVVTDQAKLAEFVHEKAQAGPRRADHFSQCFLADVRMATSE
jgi:hypothetical protein